MRDRYEERYTIEGAGRILVGIIAVFDGVAKFSERRRVRGPVW